jgi:hypothetical protein
VGIYSEPPASNSAARFFGQRLVSSPAANPRAGDVQYRLANASAALTTRCRIKGWEEFAMVERFPEEVDELRETRSIVRRQFVASVVTACLVAAVAGLIAVRPASHAAPQITAHNYLVVRQPVYVEPAERMTAAASNASSVAFDLP